MWFRLGCACLPLSLLMAAAAAGDRMPPVPSSSDDESDPWDQPAADPWAAMNAAGGHSQLGTETPAATARTLEGAAWGPTSTTPTFEMGGASVGAGLLGEQANGMAMPGQWMPPPGFPHPGLSPGWPAAMPGPCQALPGALGPPYALPLPWGMWPPSPWAMPPPFPMPTSMTAAT